MKYVSSIVLAIIVLVGCSKPLEIPCASMPRNVVEDNSVDNDIRILVMKRVVADCSYLKSTRDTYSTLFLDIGLFESPSQAFVEKMRWYIVNPVKPVSECTFKSTVLDNKTGEQGYIIRVKYIKHTGTTTASAEGSWWFGNMCASGATYDIVLKNGEWTIVKAYNFWDA